MNSSFSGYKNILFDFDGTLMDTSEGIFASFDYALTKMKIPLPSRDFYKKLIGPPLKDTFMNTFSLDEENAGKAMAFYREHYTPAGVYQVKVYEGIKQMLETLCKKGKRLFVASSKPEVYIRELLQKHSLDSYFEFAGGSDMEETRVKKNEIIEYVLSSCNIGCEQKAECVMAGDRKYDVKGASLAGIKCIGVTWGFGSEEELEEAGAVAVVHSVGELAQAL